MTEVLGMQITVLESFTDDCTSYHLMQLLRVCRLESFTIAYVYVCDCLRLTSHTLNNAMMMNPAFTLARNIESVLVEAIRR